MLPFFKLSGVRDFTGEFGEVKFLNLGHYWRFESASPWLWGLSCALQNGQQYPWLLDDPLDARNTFASQLDDQKCLQRFPVVPWQWGWGWGGEDGIAINCCFSVPTKCILEFDFCPFNSWTAWPRTGLMNPLTSVFLYAFRRAHFLSVTRRLTGRNRIKL